MNRIIKIGMDVHSTNYTLCAVEPLLEGDVNELFTLDVHPHYQEILGFIEKLKKRFRGDELSITCGYEAGCLGYKLFHDLEANGVKCVIGCICMGFEVCQMGLLQYVVFQMG